MCVYILIRLTKKRKLINGVKHRFGRIKCDMFSILCIKVSLNGDMTNRKPLICHPHIMIGHLYMIDMTCYVGPDSIRLPTWIWQGSRLKSIQIWCWPCSIVDWKVDLVNHYFVSLCTTSLYGQMMRIMIPTRSRPNDYLLYYKKFPLIHF